MKKCILSIAFSCIALISFSQKFSFSKGNVNPGKISTARAYEDFIIGRIQVIDENGTEYIFVRADFTEKIPNAKTISMDLTQPTFPEEQRGDIARGSQKGTTYTFTNIVVKDKSGKEFKVATVTYEFAGFTGN